MRFTICDKVCNDKIIGDDFKLLIEYAISIGAKEITQKHFEHGRQFRTLIEFQIKDEV